MSTNGYVEIIIDHVLCSVPLVQILGKQKTTSHLSLLFHSPAHTFLNLQVHPNESHAGHPNSNAHAECDCGNNNSYDDGFVNCVIILVVTVSWVQYVYNIFNYKVC